MRYKSDSSTMCCVYRVMGQQIIDQFSPGNPQTNDKMSDLILIFPVQVLLHGKYDIGGISCAIK